MLNPGVQNNVIAVYCKRVFIISVVNILHTWLQKFSFSFYEDFQDLVTLLSILK